MKNLLFVFLFIFYTIGLIAQTDILPPELKAPDSAAIDRMANVELDWYAVNGVGEVTYSVLIDTSSQFQNPSTYTSATSAYITENLMFGETYFWKVKAMDDTGDSDWSDPFSFTVMNEVNLHAPANGNTGAAPDVNLVWSNKLGTNNYISGITYYEIEFGLDSNAMSLESVALGTYPDDTNYYYKSTSYLLFDTTYYWRVRVKHDEDMGDWSEIWSFTTIDGINLVSPNNNATNQDVITELNWEAISGLESYIYQVCLDSNFTFPCLTDFTTLNNVTLPQLSFGGKYYWRARAAHLSDTSDWSEVRNFEIINTVNLVSPAQGDTAGFEPLLEWDYINGSEQYEVHYWSEDISTMEIEFTDTSFFQIYKILDIGVHYSWKVRSFWDSDTTEWSETRTFLSKETEGYGDLFLQQESVSIFPNPTNGQLSVQLNTISQKSIQISVIDLLGKTIFDNSYTFEQGLAKETINLNHLNDGLYLIRLQSEGKLYTEKLIIDK